MDDIIKLIAALIIILVNLFLVLASKLRQRSQRPLDPDLSEPSGGGYWEETPSWTPSDSSTPPILLERERTEIGSQPMPSPIPSARPNTQPAWTEWLGKILESEFPGMGDQINKPVPERALPISPEKKNVMVVEPTQPVPPPEKPKKIANVVVSKPTPIHPLTYLMRQSEKHPIRSAVVFSELLKPPRSVQLMRNRGIR